MSTGMVKCAPDLKAPMYCDMQLRNWPYDRQNCSLYIGSWANAGDIIDIAMDRVSLIKSSYKNSKRGRKFFKLKSNSKGCNFDLHRKVLN